MHRRPLKSSKVDPNAKCQKCLQAGHWTSDCTNERVYRSRPTRTALLKNPALKLPEANISAKVLESVEAERDTAAADILARSKALHSDEEPEEDNDTLSSTTDDDDDEGEVNEFDDLSDTTDEEDRRPVLNESEDDDGLGAPRKELARPPTLKRKRDDEAESSGYSDSD